MPKMVTVCNACLRSSCWQGISYCEGYKTAGTVDKPYDEVVALNRECTAYIKPYIFEVGA